MADNMADKKLDITPETPSDILHQHATSAVTDLTDHGSADNLEQLAAHPNLSSESLSHIYENAVKPGHVSADLGSQIFSHKNFPAHLAEDFIENQPAHRLTEDAIKVPGVDSKVLESHITKQIEDPDVNRYDLVHGENLHPNFYHSLVPELESLRAKGTLSDQEENKLDKLSRVLESGLTNTDKHTPESLTQTTQLFGNGKLLDNGISAFAKQPGLTRQHLDTLWQAGMSEDGDHRAPEILHHQNVDPALVAKYAQAAFRPDTTSRDEHQSALSSPILPDAARKAAVKKVPLSSDASWHHKRFVDSLLDNPNITENEVKSIADKGYLPALKHEKTPIDRLHQFWDKSDKKTAAVEHLLSAPNTPPEILKELVGHKNQKLAIQALSHPNVNEDVLNVALKRKAADVQEAARKHPLVADKEIRAGLTSGQVRASTIMNDKAVGQHVAQMPEDERKQALSSIENKYRGVFTPELGRSTKEDDTDFWKAKVWLVQHPDLTQEAKNAHSKDIVKYFESTNPQNQTIGNYTKHPSAALIQYLLSTGNPHAEDAVLDHPAAIQSFDWSRGDFSPEFLSKLSERAKEVHGTHVIDEFGRPDPINKYSVLNQIANNQNTSTDTFKSIVADPEFWSNIGNDSIHRLHPSRPTATVLDQHVKDNFLDQEETKKLFSHVLRQNSPHTNFAVASSATAPKDMWESAFDSLDNTSINELANHGNIAHLATDQVKSRLLQGSHNHINPHLQMQVLGGMSPDTHKDRAMARDFLLHNESLDSGDIKKMDNKDILFKINSELLNDEEGKQVIRSLAPNNPHLALSLVQDQLENAHADKPLSSEQIKQAFDDIHTTVSQSPDGDEKLARAWEGTLKDRPDLLSSLAKASKYANTANGSLDFLLNLPFDKEGTVRRQALKQNLISQEAISKMAENPQAMRDMLYGTQGESRRKLIRQAIAKPEQVHPDFARDLIASMDGGSLNPNSDQYAGGRTSTLKDEDLEGYKQNLNNMVNLTVAHAPDQLGSMLSRALALHGDTAAGEPTVKQKHELVKSLFDHLDSSIQDPIKQSQVMYSAYSELSRSRLDFPKSKLLKKIEAKAIAASDVGTLVQLAEDDKSTAAKNAIQSMLSAPQNLNSHQLIQATSLLRSDPSLEQVRSLTQAVDSRIEQDPNSISIEQAQDYIANVRRGIGGLASPETNAHLIQTLEKHATSSRSDISHNANLALGAMIGKSEVAVPRAKQVEIYKKLPDDFKMGVDLKTGDLVNNPEIIEASTGGWRLKAVSDESLNLSKRNMETWANRVINSTDPQADYCKQVTTFNAIRGNNASTQTTTSLVRSLTDKNVADIVRNLSSVTRDNILEYQIHPLIQHLTQGIHDAMKNPGKASFIDLGDGEFKQEGLQYLHPEHITKVMSHIDFIASMVPNMAFDSELPDIKPKMDALGEMIDTVHSTLTQIHDHTKQNPDTHNMIQWSMYASTAARSILAAKVDFTRDQSIKLLDLVTKGRQADPDSTPGIKVYTQSLEAWAQKAQDLKSEDWQHALTQAPELAFKISARKQIPADLMAHVDVKSMLNHDAEHTLGEVGDWFQKMETPALQAHTESILKSIRPTAETHRSLYRSTIRQAMKYAPEFISREFIQDQISSMPDHDSKADIYEDALSSGAGGPQVAHDYLKYISHQLDQSLSSDDQLNERKVTSLLRPIVNSPIINEEMGNKLLDMYQKYPDKFGTVMMDVAANKNIPESLCNAAAKHIIGQMKDGEPSQRAVAALLDNPKLTHNDFQTIYNLTKQGEYPKVFNSNTRFHPALKNAKWGGALFRSEKWELPEGVPNLQPSRMASMAQTEGLGNYAKQIERLRQAMSSIPPEGIAWAEAKKRFPNFEQIPEIKQVFMSKSNKPVFPEDFALAMKKTEAEKRQNSFFLTYARWDSKLQRHNPDGPANLVVQLNNSEQTEKALAQNPKVWALYQHLLTQSNGISGNTTGLHPTTPQLVSWCRVDTSGGKKGWVVEEIQSDFAQKFRRNLRTLIESNPGGLNLEGQYIKSDELQAIAKQIDKAVEGHHTAALDAVRQNAMSHGVSKIFMHGASVRALMSHGDKYKEYDKDYINERIRDTYERYPKQAGFEPCDYSDYPNYSNETLDGTQKKFENTQCWVMNLKKKA